MVTASTRTSVRAHRSSTALLDHLVDELCRTADGDGLLCPDVRALALTLGTTTVSVRGLLASLERAGLLVDTGAGTSALVGSPASTLADDELDRASRSSAHHAVMDGTGSARLW